ncbi:hypothetical protein GCM10023205_15940 [Yinghuangia aomiensis]|uniref:PknH-like extracellular domain-containing protein n=1 Tax=Yinghuangia aomiensis TaxID=676205 RepID=A0ABP9H2X6_9ACTN
MPDDHLDRRLRDLVDELDQAVVLSPAHEARARGARLRHRTRIAVGTAVVAGAAVTAASITWAAGPERGATQAGPASPSASASCGAAPTPPTASAATPFPTEPKPTITPSSIPPPSLPPTPPTAAATATKAAPPTMASLPPGSPLASPVVTCPQISVRFPADPRALTTADLPVVPGGTWIPPRISWEITRTDAVGAPGVFCLPRAGAAQATPTTETSYALGGNPPPATFVETIADFATEQDARAAMDTLAAALRDCPTTQPGASVSRVSGPDDAQLWKADNGSGTHGFQALARSGKTVVTLAYLQSGDFHDALSPDLLATALTRAAGNR